MSTYLELCVRLTQSQGLNFAEAVNFATPDWLIWGSKCLKQYRAVGRYPVFAHDELLCGLAERCESLDAQVSPPFFSYFSFLIFSLFPYVPASGFAGRHSLTIKATGMGVTIVDGVIALQVSPRAKDSIINWFKSISSLFPL